MRGLLRDERAQAVAATLGAALLLLFAFDVVRFDRALRADDLRFHAAPRQAELWTAQPLLGPATRGALTASDDLAFRRALQLFARIEPGKVDIYGSRLETTRSAAQLELARLSQADDDPRRQSIATNLLGVIGLAANEGGFASRFDDPIQRANVLRTAIGTFRNAVRLDDTNTDAKVNLELVLRDAGAYQLSGDDPTGSQAEGEQTGAGRSGSGY